MSNSTIFRLKVTRFERNCLFELSWGIGQQLSATLNYPESITALYAEWQRAYLSFYQNPLPTDGIGARGEENISPAQRFNIPGFIKRIFAGISPPPPALFPNQEKAVENDSTSELRGRVEGAGTMAASSVDWHAKLVQAEAALTYEFHHWLRSADLYEIRVSIARAATNLKDSVLPPEQKYIDVFLTLDNNELERLPWETWEIGAESGLSQLIRIARTPVNIRHSPVQPRRGRTRILAILGDDTGLNFKDDKLAVRELSRIANIKFIGWQPGKDINELRNEILQALVSPQGWDVLFFAGHSNETALTGGELGIAPGASMSISEIIPQLLLARELGLQFALFNSCSGINIAESLIDLGFSQVVVMREPIHNQVAQKFIHRFMQELATHRDVYLAQLAACQELQVNNNITYPSAYLIPSLFRHPSATLFRLKSWTKQWLQEILPTRKQALALSTLMVVSILTPVQSLLLEPRLGLQAMYRDFTAQIPPLATPPVLLVHIDDNSLREAGIDARKRSTIDRTYIASILELENFQLLQPKVVGTDFVFDSPTDEDGKLAKSISNLASQGTWLVFAAERKDTGSVTKLTKTVASLNWSLQGHIGFYPGYVELLPALPDYRYNYPFAYLLALAHRLNQEPSTALPQPQLSRNTSFGKEVFDYLNRQSKHNSNLIFLINLQKRQQWFQPLIDFSIPPNQVYDIIPVWKFKNLSVSELQQIKLKQQIVMIAPGGYEQAGVTSSGSDNFPIPMAVSYWLKKTKSSDLSVFTGSQYHAYTIHHLLTQHLVVPIPDWCMVVVAVLLGKGTVIIFKQQRQKKNWLIALVSSTIIYGLASCQIYISGAVLLPWLLPSIAFLICAIPVFSRRNYYG